MLACSSKQKKLYLRTSEEQRKFIGVILTKLRKRKALASFLKRKLRYMLKTNLAVDLMLSFRARH